MIFIAHRGNLNGPNIYEENSPKYILKAIQSNYDCEIDVRLIGNELYLGHDNPDYKININFLLDNSKQLWIHCKNIDALGYLIQYNELNIFWHQQDSYTLTSHGYIWSFPDSQITYLDKSILLMPEWNNYNSLKKYPNCYGICSDYITNIQIILAEDTTYFPKEVQTV